MEQQIVVQNIVNRSARMSEISSKHIVPNISRFILTFQSGIFNINI